MELKRTDLYFRLNGKVHGLNRTDHGYGVKEDLLSSGTPYKKARFNVELEDNTKVMVDIFGMPKDKVYYFNGETKKTDVGTWEERDALKENKNNRVYPIPYDAVTNLSIADDGDFFDVSGKIEAATNKDGRIFYNLNGDTAEELQKENYYNDIYGEFIFDKTVKENGNMFVKGFLVNYKQEVFPIELLWIDKEETFDEIKKVFEFGCRCFTNGGCVSYLKISEDKEETNDEEFVLGSGYKKTVALKQFFCIRNIGKRKTEPYTREDLFGISDDSEPDVV